MTSGTCRDFRSISRASRAAAIASSATRPARHQGLTAATGVRIFFAERSSPWQRGANENYNGLVRQYFPKGTNLAVHSLTHSPTHVAYVTAELNERPRKGLGYDTPAFRIANETAATPTR